MSGKSLYNINAIKTIALFLLLFCNSISTRAQDINYEDSVRYYYQKGVYRTAAAYADKSLRECRNTKTPMDTCICVRTGNLAHLFTLLGKFNDAEILFTESIKLAEQTYGKNHYQYAAIINNYGKLKKETGKFTEAESLIREALSITKNRPGKYLDHYLIQLSDLGFLYIDAGNYITAEALFTEVIDSLKKDPARDKSLTYGNALNNLAAVHNYMGNYAAAAKIFSELKDIYISLYTPEHPTTATVIGNLGFINMNAGDYSTADSLLQWAMELKEKLFTRNSDVYAIAVNTLGKLNMKMGNYKEAERYFLEALGIRKEVLGISHPNYAITCGDLGSFYFSTGNDRKSQEYFELALMLTRKFIGENNLSYLNLAYNLTNLFAATGEYQKADSILRRAATIEKELLTLHMTTLSEKELLAYIKSRETGLTLPITLLEYSELPTLLETAFDNCLAYKGASVQNINRITREVSQSTDSSLRLKWAEFRKSKTLLNKINAIPQANRPYAIDSLSDACNKLEKEMLNSLTNYKGLLEKSNTTWKMIKEELSGSDAAIEYVRFKKIKRRSIDPDTICYASILITHSSAAPVYIYLGTETELKSSLKAFAYKSPGLTELISKDSAVKKIKGKAPALFDFLWRPLLPYLAQKKTIYFSPDGLLYQIAFAAIPDRKGALLSDRYKLVQLTSTRQLKAGKKNIPFPESAALFGGINYNRQDAKVNVKLPDNTYNYIYRQHRGPIRDSFDYLPNTLKEVQLIKNIITPKQKLLSIYTGSAATESAFQRLGDSLSPGVIHIATHGFSLPDTVLQRNSGTAYKTSENPLLRSGLVMAGGNNGWKGRDQLNEDDGILSSLEITSLTLANTELVVLSACETGVGEIQGTEGVFGLQRAFKIAGVNNIIASLWPVSDSITKEFMTQFYMRWFGGKTIQSSFYETQQIMKSRHTPIFWAPFTLIK